MGASPVFVDTPISYVANTTASSTAAVDLIDATASSSATVRLENLTVYNAHSSAQSVTVQFSVSSVAYPIYTTSVAAAGAVNILESLYSSPEKQILIVWQGQKLQIKPGASFAASITGIANGGTYA